MFVLFILFFCTMLLKTRSHKRFYKIFDCIANVKRIKLSYFISLFLWIQLRYISIPNAELNTQPPSTNVVHVILYTCSSPCSIYKHKWLTLYALRNIFYYYSILLSSFDIQNVKKNIFICILQCFLSDKIILISIKLSASQRNLLASIYSK